MTYCISETNNVQADSAKDIDVGMPIYNSIEYGDNYSKTFGSLWKHFRNGTAVNGNDNIVEFNAANPTTNSSK